MSACVHAWDMGYKFLDWVRRRAEKRIRIAAALLGIIVGAHGAADDDWGAPKAGGIRRICSGRVTACKGKARVDGDEIVLQLRFESEKGEEQARVLRGRRYHPVHRLAVVVFEATQQAA
jgi:hypothetical protein